MPVLPLIYSVEVTCLFTAIIWLYEEPAQNSKIAQLICQNVYCIRFTNFISFPLINAGNEMQNI